MKIQVIILLTTIAFVPVVCSASPLSKLFSEALSGVVESTPQITSKFIQKGVQVQTRDQIKIEDEMTSRLKGIDEKTGKMANSITNLIFAFNTKDQKLISKSEYDRIHGEFKKRVSGDTLSQVKLVFLLNLKCNEYAIDLFDAIQEDLKTGHPVTGFIAPVNDLRKCSAYLNLIKGYNADAANSYETLVKKLDPFFKTDKKLGKNESQILSRELNAALDYLRSNQYNVQVASSKWF